MMYISVRMYDLGGLPGAGIAATMATGKVGIATTTQTVGVAGGGRQYTFKELEEQIQKVC